MQVSERERERFRQLIARAPRFFPTQSVGNILEPIGQHNPSDVVLVMSVEPGFGGQSFDPAAVDRIARLAEWRHQGGHDYAISVDGGIDATTAPAVLAAGADILVSGTFFCRATDRAAAAASLRAR